MKNLLLGAAALLMLPMTANADHHARSDYTIIHAGTLIAVPGETPLRAQSVVVRNGKVERIVAGYLSDDAAKTVDLKTMTVLPGLIDSHVHLAFEFSPTLRLDLFTKEDADVAYDAADNARKTLMAGFTAVQDVGGPPAIMALSRAVDSGKMIGPHIRAAGGVSITGGHMENAGYRADILEFSQLPTNCDGADDCRRATRLAIKNGADLIKIASTGGVLSNTNAGLGQQMTTPELEAIVDAARAMGRKVTAHAHGKNGIDAALRAGAQSIEHGTFGDVETIRLYKQYDAVMVPTLLAGMTVMQWNFLPPASAQKAAEAAPKAIENLRLAHEAGVTIAFGTDTGVSKHGDNAQEFQYMVEAGMSPMEAIASATIIAAKHIEMSDKIGSLQAGKYADIIAVDGDPLKDVAELMDVDFVMKGGVVYKNEN